MTHRGTESALPEGTEFSFCNMDGTPCTPIFRSGEGKLLPKQDRALCRTTKGGKLYEFDIERGILVRYDEWDFVLDIIRKERGWVDKTKNAIRNGDIPHGLSIGGTSFPTLLAQYFCDASDETLDAIFSEWFRAGGNANQEGDDGIVPLHFLCLNRKWATAGFVIDNGGDMLSGKDETPLHQAFRGSITRSSSKRCVQGIRWIRNIIEDLAAQNEEKVADVLSFALDEMSKIFTEENSKENNVIELAAACSSLSPFMLSSGIPEESILNTFSFSPQASDEAQSYLLGRGMRGRQRNSAGI